MSNKEDKNTIDYVRDILIQATGYRMYSIEELSRIAADMIQGDRITIKILGRNIESLTQQMKDITRVTFERDNLKERLDICIERNKHLVERLAKYEE